MALEFIDIKRTSAENEDEARTSALAFSEKFEGLRVVGNLPHGYEFELRNVAAARKLISWLERWILKQSGLIDGRDIDDIRRESEIFDGGE